MLKNNFLMYMYSIFGVIRLVSFKREQYIFHIREEDKSLSTQTFFLSGATQILHTVRFSYVYTSGEDAKHLLLYECWNSIGRHSIFWTTVIIGTPCVIGTPWFFVWHSKHTLSANGYLHAIILWFIVCKIQL